MADAEQQQLPAAAEADASSNVDDDDDLEFSQNDKLAVVLPRVAPADADVFLASRLGDCARLREILSESPELVISRDRFDATVRGKSFFSFFCFFSPSVSFLLLNPPPPSPPLLFFEKNSHYPTPAPPPRLALRLPRRRQPPHRARRALRRLHL